MDVRYVVRDGIGANDDGSGPPECWWAYRQVLVGVEEYEPGFPVLDEAWEDDDSFEPVSFDDEAAAFAATERVNNDDRPCRGRGPGQRCWPNGRCSICSPLELVR